jgi:hypothetical protein
MLRTRGVHTCWRCGGSSENCRSGKADSSFTTLSASLRCRFRSES